MFVQVIQGQVTDAGKLRASLDRWLEELAPGSIGWLGSTGGVTDDGRFIALVRFESEDAARRNGERPEQDKWWSETATLLKGEATFHDSSDVFVDINGDPDQAGFVQVMQGRGSDPERAKELMEDDSVDWTAFRPEIIGSLGATYDDGAYTMAIYFTSEAEARAGESKEPPPEIQAAMAEMEKLTVGETEFFDLKDPWLHSPR